MLRTTSLRATEATLKAELSKDKEQKRAESEDCLKIYRKIWKYCYTQGIIEYDKENEYRNPLG